MLKFVVEIHESGVRVAEPDRASFVVVPNPFGYSFFNDGSILGAVN